MFCGKPFILTSRLIAREGYEDRVKTLLEEAVNRLSGQDGLILYCLHQEKNNPAEFLLYGQFTSQASFRMHLDSDIVRSIHDEIAGMLKKVPKLESWDIIKKTGEMKCR